MGSLLGQHAVVIGGSVTGLMTARVLADHFDQVTVLERDHIDGQPAVHKSIPQGNHVHGLLLGGKQVLSSLYPDFIDNLRQLGAVPYRLGEELVWYLPDGKAYSASATPVREPQYLGGEGYSQSRGLLEHCVRRCTLALPNVKCESDSLVQGLVYDKGRVHGVRYAHAGRVDALATDLVVDAGGRGSHVPRWLTELGLQPPRETAIGVDIGYASTKYRIPAAYDEPDRMQVFLGPPPQFPNVAVIEEIEHHTWHVTLVGRFGQYPPT
jgi:flavin-dependent dehydrogenase